MSNYPPGAANDPNAPYNEPLTKYAKIRAEVTVDIGTMVDVFVEVDEDGYKHHYAGMTHNVTQKIEIARNVKEEKLSNEMMCKTLIHELVHVICNTGAYFNYSNDESFVEFMTRGILSLLKQDLICK